MKYTQYFLVTREREDRKDIELKWIEYVYNNPVSEEIQTDGRIKRWAYINEMQKYLRIIILEDKETIHNAFSIEILKYKTMKITYFEDTDTLLVYFNDNEIVETKDINENTLIELDADGKVVSMTIEHAKNQTEISSFSFNQVAKLAI